LAVLVATSSRVGRARINVSSRAHGWTWRWYRRASARVVTTAVRVTVKISVVGSSTSLSHGRGCREERKREGGHEGEARHVVLFEL